MNAAVESEKRLPKWSVLGSVMMIVAGSLAIIAPLETSIRIVLILSWVLIFSGVGHLVAALRFKSFENLVWDLLLAILHIVMGLYFVLHPQLALAPLTLVLAGLFLLNGILELLFYFGIRSTPRSAGILLNAALSFILGFLIFQHWLANAMWLLGALVGISLVFGGISRLALTTGTRRMNSAAA
ncbi:MAG TPA: DUF308 domain-containing protein [Terriglobales bacterium]|jgi:uncharacterized membrane protein HdeD (DUF308 family)|nr:DUF308 domain-containing protein [Terriglobales bacterium]